MKKSILTLAILAAGTLFVNAQVQKFSNLKMSTAATAIPSLLNKDMATVMKELKLTAKDTIGKTGQAMYSKIDPVNKITTLKLADGETLGFKANKLIGLLPKQ